MSRYADVIIALPSDHMVPIGSLRHERPDAQHEVARLKLRGETLAALSPTRLVSWRSQLAALADHIVEALPSDRRVDLVGELLQPWCLAMAIMVTGADPSDSARLAGLASYLSVFNSTANDPAQKSRAIAASEELKQALPNAGGGESTFVALSQTLPGFLANGWLALLRNPAQLERLQQDRDLMSGAIDEMLRYAGVAQRLYRRATRDLRIDGATITAGESVILMVASANRDPDQFPDPDCLNIERHPAGQLGLGAAAHSCVAAALIRMGAAVATAALIGRLDAETVCPMPHWSRGDDVRCVSALEVVMRPASQ